MKQIYDFERARPPALSERMLRKEAERRRTGAVTALLAVAGLLTQLVVLIFGVLMFGFYPWVTAVCFLYVLISLTGGGVLALVLTKKGGVLQ